MENYEDILIETEDEETSGSELETDKVCNHTATTVAIALMIIFLALAFML